MKSVKEIRQEADAVYQKSSHYIVGTFMSIAVITALANAMLQIIGVSIGIGYITLLACLFTPLEYGMVKSSLLAYKHEARKVRTKEMLGESFGALVKYLVPFAGRTLIVQGAQALIVALFAYIGTGNFNEFGSALSMILSGTTNGLIVDGVFTISVATLLGIFVALILGFILNAGFALSYYYVLEEGQGLAESLSSSLNAMAGHLWTYILVKLSYIPYAIIVAICVNVLSISLQRMFYQLMSLSTSVPVEVYTTILNGITATVSAFLSVMLYKVKENLAIMIMYQDTK